MITMMCWCVNDCVQVSALLLLKGADPDVALKGSGETPLFLACQHGKSECVALLLMAGADAKRARRDGYTPAEAASMSGHPACCALIEEAASLPRPPVFAAAVVERARSLLLPPTDGPLLGATPIDERAFARCLERARALDVAEEALKALETLAEQARKARLYNQGEGSRSLLGGGKWASVGAGDNGRGRR